MSIAYQVDWKQEIAGINFCIARANYSGELGEMFELFALPSNQPYPNFTKNFSIAFYHPEDDNKLNMTDFFQKKINAFVLEQYGNLYEILNYHYTMKTKDIFLSANLKDKFETMFTFLVKIGYIKNFYSTRECIVYERKPRTIYEKLVREKNIYRITFTT